MSDSPLHARHGNYPSSLDADLATLKRLVDAEWRRWDDDHGPEEGVDAPREYDVAYKRVEAELARLRQENGDLNAAYFSVNAKRDAAEREVARLQEGLRVLDIYVEDALADGHPSIPEMIVVHRRVRALLAEDTPGKDGAS